MKKITLTLLLLASFSFAANAQWYKLQPYWPGIVNPGSNIGYPLSPSIAGNGVILYGVTNNTSPSNGQYSIFESNNDLNTDHATYSYNGLGCCGYNSPTSKNDSTHCFLFDNNSYWPFLYYTNNNFKTVTTYTNT